MFIIFGFDRRRGGEIMVCDKNGRRYTLFYIGNCFSIFFIPLFNISKSFYISVGGNQREITKEEYKQMKESGYVLEAYENMSEHSGGFRQAYDAAAYSQADPNNGAGNQENAYAGGVCPVCKKPLETSFAFCPYCGQKRPRV